jgi:acyl-ACP thioesterase
VEEKLIFMYEKTMKEGEKINITQHVKHIKEKEDWIMLDQ